MRFDTQWTEAISLMGEEPLRLLTDAVLRYQKHDILPEGLAPELMAVFMLIKSVVDRRKRVNARARERRLARRKTLHSCDILAIAESCSPTAATSSSRPDCGPVTADYHKALPGYRAAFRRSFPGQVVDNNRDMILAWCGIVRRDAEFIGTIAARHRCTADFITDHLHLYNCDLLQSHTVSVDCLNDYKIEFDRYIRDIRRCMRRVSYI